MQLNADLEYIDGLLPVEVVVADNPAMADGSSLHHDAKQQLHQYLRTYIQPLMRAGKQASWQDILLQVNSRKPKLVQQLGKQQVQHMAQMLLLS